MVVPTMQGDGLPWSIRLSEHTVVSMDQVDGEKVIIAKPNHSSSWRHNLWLLGALAVPSLGAGIGFALLGAWPILPLAGLELAALGGALYWVNWKLEYRHVIRLTDDLITVDKGYFVPKRRWCLNDGSPHCGWCQSLITGRARTVSARPPVRDSYWGFPQQRRSAGATESAR